MGRLAPHKRRPEKYKVDGEHAWNVGDLWLIFDDPKLEVRGNRIRLVRIAGMRVKNHVLFPSLRALDGNKEMIDFDSEIVLLNAEQKRLISSWPEIISKYDTPKKGRKLSLQQAVNMI